MPASDTEDPSFIGDDGPAELRNVEGVAEADLVRNHLVNVEKVDRLAAPFEIVHELMRGVTLLQDESVVE